MKPFSRTLVTLAVVATCSLASAATVPPAPKFLANAMQDGMAEVASCQLALQKTTNPKVKSFAEKMITDHTKTDEAITALAKGKNYKLPDSVTLKQKATFELLRTHSGTGFDRTFMKHNISDHQQDIKDFSEQAQNSADPDVKAFAVTTLETLREHLALSQEVSSAVGNTNK